MRILVFGASGRIGATICAEAAFRGHAVVRAIRPKPPGHGGTAGDAGDDQVVADVLSAASVREAAITAEVVVSAVGPRQGPEDADVVILAARALIEGLRGTSTRLLVVGGAGSLEVSPGVDFLDTPEFPDFARATSEAARTALRVFRTEAGEVDWLVLSPPALIGDGARTGTYRRGTDQVLRDADGISRISRADFAYALLDEIEQPTTHRARITVAYS